MSKIVRCAIVGCGVIGPTHAKAIEAIDNAQLIMACDIVQERAEALAAGHPGCVAVTDFQEVLNNPEVDLVHICLPSGMHAEYGCMAARAGKHVVTEKPIDVTLEAADRLINTCKECGVVLSTISQHRFDPGIVRLKTAIDDGKLGRITFGGSHTKWWRSQEYYDSGDWRGTWALDGGGALMNQSVHYVDMLQYTCGKVEEVQAYCATLVHERIEVEDVAVASVKFENGAVGLIEGNTTAYPGFCTRLDVYSDKGGVVIQDDKVLEWKLEGEEAGESPEGGSAASSAAIGADSHTRQINDVVNAILENRAPAVTGEDARHPLAIILAIYESARIHGPVKVK